VANTRHSKLGERWRNEEAIATGFVESAVKQIVSKAVCQKAAMQWTKKRAHVVLQIRTQLLDSSISAWEIPFVTGIQTSGQNLKTRSSRRLKHWVFYAPQDKRESVNGEAWFRQCSSRWNLSTAGSNLFCSRIRFHLQNDTA
jgi:hypothetical protein